MNTALKHFRKRYRLGILFSAAAAFPALVSAQTWNSGSGNWNVAGNWNPAAVPGAAAPVNITNADAADRVINYDYNGPAVTLGSLSINNSSGGTETLSMATAGLALTADGESIGGYAGSTGTGVGAVIQSAGVNTDGNALVLGYNAGDSGQYNLSGTGTLWESYVYTSEYVGYSGAGVFIHSGGTNRGALNLILGYNSGATGAYTLSGTGSLAIAGKEYIGYNGTGNFNQTGGTNTLGSFLDIGRGAGSSTYSLSGAGSLSAAGGELLGDGVPGYFIQTGGMNSLTNGSYLDIGYGPGQTGYYTLSGTGSLLDSGEEVVGFRGAGFFNQSGGINTVTGSNVLDLAPYSYTSGSYTLSAGSLNSAAGEDIGAGGKATFIQTGGTNVTGTMSIAFSPGSTGAYTLGGTGSLSSSVVYVGGGGNPGGTGVLTIDGQAVFNAVGTVTVYNTPGSGFNIKGGSAVVNLLALEGGSYTQSGGSASFARITGNGQAVITGGKTALLPIAAASTLAALTVTTGGILDVANNKVIITYGSPANDPASSIVPALRSGRNGGSWTGSGINSSTAAANPAEFALGYADGNADPGTPAQANQLVILYTLAADANLDGVVGFADLLSVAQNYGAAARDWAHGNLTYDPAGSVGFADLLLVAQEYGQSTTVAGQGLPAFFSPAWQSSQAQSRSVPEPSALGLAVAGAAALLTRRRR